MQPHRGVLVLVLGILGLVMCFPLGIGAWVMGNNDLAAMSAGNMDPEGRGLTQAGKVCGMVGVLLQVGVLALWVVFFVLTIGLAASA